MAKAHFIGTFFDSATGVAITSATVNVYNPGTVTPISATIFDKSNNPLSNPLTSDATTGLVDFYLTVAQTVDLNVSKSGFTTRTYSNVMVLDDAGFDNTAVLTTTGDLLYASANNTPARLPVSGTTGALLNVASGVPAWSTVIQLSTSVNAVGIGTAAANYAGLTIQPQNLSASSTNSYMLIINGTFQSVTTGTGTVINANVATAAASFTMTNGNGLLVAPPVVGAASAITNIYGVRVNNQGTSGITNAYGVYIDAQSGAATLNYGLYAVGNNNFLGASVATNATKGFAYISFCAGTPTGTPTDTSSIPMCYDQTNHKIWFYDNGAWRGVAVA